MRITIRLIGTVAGLLVLAAPATRGQGSSGLSELQRTPAVSGHEQKLAGEIQKRLTRFGPKTDQIGNVWVTIGSGSPHRLIASSIDEPGYVVSEITGDGYLRVQRLPQAPPNGLFDALQFAQPVVVMTRSGKEVSGVFAGLSVHLQPGRLNPPKMNHVQELYVDIGAKSAAEVRAAGVDVLDPIALRRASFMVGNGGWAGPGVENKVACDTLLNLVDRSKEIKLAGTTTIAFVTQQWTGGRGLNRLLTEMTPDEMIYVGRVTPAAEKQAMESAQKPGTGLLLGVQSSGSEGENSVVSQLKALAEKNRIAIETVNAAPLRIASYTKSASLPGNFAQLGMPILWPVTPAETVFSSDVADLEQLLEAYLDMPASGSGSGGNIGSNHEQSDIAALTEAYGASRHEDAVRKTVLGRLPEWAQKRATTDSAENLVLHVGDGKKNEKTPRLVFVAHMDEIGYEVKKIEDDGRLQVDVLGGGYPQFFLGHVVLVHTKTGQPVGGVLELPAGWDKPGFELPSSMRSMDEPAHVFVGTNSKAETEKLGIALGDFVTIPKQFRPLVGTRANARSLDDRVGCAALIAAVRAIGPSLPGRDVTFVWSTEEELGLFGAVAFAEQAAKEGREPDFVFAIDTFVSSDSPLETKRFADAQVGKGFVVRAVDNSNMVPVQYVDRVVALAKENGIAAQYGVTGGGNDGSVFTRYGAVDVALGWPLRYAHSPGEVIDTKDLDALGKIIAVLARRW